MKVVHVAGKCPPGASGGTRLVVDLACSLKLHNDVECVFVGTVTANPVYAPVLEEAGVPVVNLYVPPVRKSLLGALKAWRMLKSHPQLRDIDVVHAHSNVSVPARLARRCGVPLVINAHGDPSGQTSSDWRERVSRWYHASVYSKATAVVAVSEHVREDVLRRLGNASVTSRVIHNGCDVNAFCPGEITTPNSLLARLRSEGRVLCGIVGRVARGKRSMDVLDLAEATVRELPQLAFVFVGDGILSEQVRVEVRQRGLEDRVFLLGFQSEIAEVYRQLDVLVHVSPHEPFGLIYIEAMACGLPVVGAAGSAVHEIVLPNETGFICNPGKWEEWTQALQELAEPERRRYMGDAGLQRARENFSVEAMVDKYVALYREVTGTDG